MRTTLFVCSVLLLAGGALAAPPDAATLMKKMKAALEPDRSSTRQLSFRMSGGPWPTQAQGEGPHIVLGQARKKVGGAARIVNVVLAPKDLRGMVYLVQEGGGAQNLQWVYIPAIGRVRQIQSNEAYTSFLNSDFTYADLGFVSIGSTVKVLGTASKDGRDTVELQAVPKLTWYYARIVDFVAKDSALPVERDFYDPANAPWKVERFAAPTDIQGVPTILRITMEDMQAKNRTDVEVTSVTYDVDVPDALFDPGQLPLAVSSPVWGSLKP